MQRKILVIAGSIFGGAALLLAGGVAYIANFDLNAHKDMIVSQFREATGRELTLAGELGLSIYPWLGVVVNDASISNAEGFSASPLLQIDHAEVRIKLLPLLRDQYEIDTVRLDGVAASLEVASDGSNNWTFATGDVPAEEINANAESSDNLRINKLIIGGVDIRNTSIVYTDNSTNSRYDINDINVQVPALVYGEPLALTMNARATVSDPQLSGDIALNGTVLYDVDNGLYRLDPLQLTTRLSGPTAPEGSADLELLTNFSVDTTADTLSLPSLQLSALGIKMQGKLVVSEFSSESPSVNATLAANGNDFSLLFRVLGQNELAARIRRLDSKFALNTSIEANMDSGVVSLPALELSMLGATVSGTLNATGANSDEPVVSGRLQALGPDMPALMEVIGTLQDGSDSPLAQTGRNLASISDKGFSLQTEFNADMAAGDILLPALTANLLGFRINGSLSAEDIDNDGNIAGNLTMQSGDLREVLRALGQGGLADVAQSLTLDIQLGGSSENLRISPLNLSLIVAGSTLGPTPQTLAFNADTAVNLTSDSLTVENFTVEGIGLNLGGSVTATQLTTNLRYEGKVSLPTFNAREFMAKLNLDPPATTDNSVLQRVTLDTEFSGGENTLALDTFVFGLDDTTVNGKLNVTDIANLGLTFDINVDKIDADRYLAPSTETETVTNEDATPLPTDTLRQLNLQGQLSIGELTISGLQMKAIKVPLAAKAGVISLSPLTAQLYGGNFNGNIALDASGREAIATVATTLNAIELAPLMLDFAGASYASGTGNIELSLSGQGNDSAAIKQTLSGDGKLALTNGVLQGVDIGASLTALETMIRSKRLVDLPEGGETTFENFAATLQIASGVATSDDLLVKAPGWQLQGTGTLADLRRNSMSLNLIAITDASTATVADQQYDIGGHQLPIVCSGELTSPLCLPDAKAIIASAVSNVLQDRIGNFLQQRLGGQQTETAPAAPEQPNDGATQPEQKPEQQLLNRALDRFLR